jgi:hypothetical protein
MAICLNNSTLQVQMWVQDTALSIIRTRNRHTKRTQLDKPAFRAHMSSGILFLYACAGNLNWKFQRGNGWPPSMRTYIYTK